MPYKEDSGTAFPTIFPDHGGATEGMTLRTYAAIKLKVPDSGIDWLDEMIQKSRRDDFAAKAMQGILSDHMFDEEKSIVGAAYDIANDMLKVAK